MIYKTLHWYILRELLRIFLMTAAALTTLMAFGGTFKPLTKQGLDLGRLLLVLFNLMPAMLAYAIPMAALFAAVLVYWRLSTDNEITACRASGVSFTSILIPAFILGISVASADLVFVNYVVPVFVQRFERTIRTDLGAILATKIARQEPFESNELPVIVKADDAASRVFTGDEISPRDRSRGVTSQTVVTLRGMSTSVQGKDKDKPSYVVFARVANVIFDEIGATDEVQVRVLMQDAAGYQFDTFNKISGELSSIPPNGEPYTIPSLVKNKTKYLNILQLNNLNHDPYLSPDIQQLDDDMKRAWIHQQMAFGMAVNYKAHAPAPVRFRKSDGSVVQVYSPSIIKDDEGRFVFTAANGRAVKVEEYQGNTLTTDYSCDSVNVTLSEGDLATPPGADTRAMLELVGNVLRKDVVQQSTQRIGAYIIQPLQLPPDTPLSFTWDRDAVRNHPEKFTPAIQRRVADMQSTMANLFQTIKSEFNSRGSFALSCLTLVLLGAALGIIMRGRNPLLVFVLGFVPALAVVLLIVAGRRMIEDASGGTGFGLSVVWAGNVLLLVLVAVVYGKLLRS